MREVSAALQHSSHEHTHHWLSSHNPLIPHPLSSHSPLHTSTPRITSPPRPSTVFASSSCVCVSACLSVCVCVCRMHCRHKFSVSLTQPSHVGAQTSTADTYSASPPSTPDRTTLSSGCALSLLRGSTQSLDRTIS